MNRALSIGEKQIVVDHITDEVRGINMKGERHSFLKFDDEAQTNLHSLCSLSPYHRLIIATLNLFLPHVFRASVYSKETKKLLGETSL